MALGYYSCQAVNDFWALLRLGVIGIAHAFAVISQVASDFNIWIEQVTHMTYRYPKRLALLELACAVLMAVALYVNTHPDFWGWLLFSPLFFYIVFVAVRTYRYSLTIDIDGGQISVSDSERQYRVSDIAAINVWDAKGEKIAVVTFADRNKISFPSHLDGFNDLVTSLRELTNLPKPASET
jgi:hypothetical protein